MPNKRPTIVDIAKRLKISPASVSRALADNTRISAGLRQQVQKTAAEIGYVANTAARALRTGKPDMAALMVPNLSVLKLDGNLDALLAIDDELGQQGIRLMVASYHQPNLAPNTMKKVMADPRLAGLLFLTNYITDQLLDVISKSTVPTVIVNAYPERTWEKWENMFCVGTENLKGAQIATKHLIANGHTRIGALVCEPGKRDADLREEGYQEAMKEAGLEVKPSYMVRCDFMNGFTTGVSAMARLLADTGSDRPTALFCSSDFIAAGAVRGLKEAGLRVPEDIELFGFGNHPMSVAMNPSLSSVTHDCEKVGRQAAALFLDLVNQQESKQTQVLQPAQLILRESARPVRPQAAPAAPPAPAPEAPPPHA